MAIAYGGATQFTATTGATFSFAGPTVSGTNTAMVILVLMRNGTASVTSVTVDGVSASEELDTASAGAALSAGLYSFINPPSGATIFGTIAGTGIKRVIATYFTGVDQTDMIEAVVSGAGTVSSDPSTSINTVSANAWVVDGMVSESADALTPDGSQSTIFSTDEGSWATGGSYEGPVASPGSVTMSWTGTDSTWLQVLAALKPAAGGAPPPNSGFFAIL